MPAFLVGILPAVLSYLLARVIFRVITALGVGYVSFQGFEALATAIQNFVTNQLGAMPPQVGQILEILNVYTAINLVLSAQFARLTLLPIYRKFVVGPVTGQT